MSAPITSQRKTPWLVPLATCLAIGLICRASILIVVGNALGSAGTLEHDHDAYRIIADNLSQRGVFSSTPLDKPPSTTAFRPPLYPIILSLVSTGERLGNGPVAVLHLLLGLGTITATFALARQWQLSDWSASVAAILVACDPLLLNQSAFVMTETTATFLTVISTLVLGAIGDKRSLFKAIVAGALLGLAALCRPTFLVWIAFIAVGLLLGRRSWKQRFSLVTVVSVVVLVLLAPWTIRNQQQLGKPIIATTHGGYTLLLANNDQFYDFLRVPGDRTVWDAEELHEKLREAQATDEADGPRDEHPEVRQNRICYERAFATIQARPIDFAYSCITRVVRLWRPLPHQLDAAESSRRRAFRYATCAWYSVAFALTIVGLIAERRRLFKSPIVWSILFVASLTLVHTFFWSNIRMRAPAMPIVYCFAVLGATTLVQMTGRSRHSTGRST